MFEALSACSVAERLELIAPVHGDALRSLLDPGQPMATRTEYAVLWLDDLEPFLTQGVTWQTLREWQSSRPGLSFECTVARTFPIKNVRRHSIGLRRSDRSRWCKRV